VGDPREQARYEADCAAGKPNRFGSNDIVYWYNSQGFRCIEFNQIPKNSYVVLAVGDSNTERRRIRLKMDRLRKSDSCNYPMF
jgi:hypothetical protein